MLLIRTVSLLALCAADRLHRSPCLISTAALSGMATPVWGGNKSTGHRKACDRSATGADPPQPAAVASSSTGFFAVSIFVFKLIIKLIDEL